MSASSRIMFVPKVCRSCEELGECPRERAKVQKCYDHMYNTTQRDKQAEADRQKDLRKYYFARYMMYKTRWQAKKKGFECTLDLPWFEAGLTRGTCQITGLPFVKPTYQAGKRGRRGPYTPSVDRIDNAKGYTKDNCRMVIWMANLAKNCYRESDLARLCKAYTAVDISQQLSVYQQEVKTVAESVFVSLEQSMDDTSSDSELTKDIFKCAEEGDIKGLETCLHRGDDINTLKDGKNALFYTTDMSCAKILIQYGIDVNHEDDNGMTAVHSAVYAGERDLVQYLIRISTRSEWASLTMDQIHRSCESDILRRSAYAVLAQRTRQMPLVR